MAYEEAWAEYRGAIGALYETHPDAIAERGSAQITASDDLEARADAVVERSEQLAREAAVGLESERQDVRELAELQLVAAAALDLIVADDLVGQADGQQVTEPERGSTLPAATAELFAVLDAPQSAGIAGVLGDESQIERGGDPSDPVAAKQRLLESVKTTIDDIVTDAGKGGSAIVTGVLELPAAPLAEAASAALHEVLGQIGDNVSRLIQRAVRLVVKAIEKLFAILGKETEREAREEAAEWMKKLKEGEILGSVLAFLYEPDRLKQEVEAGLADSSADADAFNKRVHELERLSDRFGKQRKIVQWLARGLALIRKWLFGIQPWGPVAAVGAHLVAFGYIVYLGGDYVDWYRADRARLNFVTGVRQIAAS
jgi:hypothetical protein